MSPRIGTGRRPGLFVVDRDGAMIGLITLDRATGNVRPAAGEAELGYLFLPQAWGCGYAAEALAAALAWSVISPVRRSR